MPGDDEVRKAVEREEVLGDEREEYELHQGSSGEWVRVPKEALSVEHVDGRLVKKKIVLGAQTFSGCRHRKLSPEQEAALIARTGQRYGFCEVDGREYCAECLGRPCSECGTFYKSCSRCGKTACKKCLEVKTKNDKPAESETPAKHSCSAMCKECLNPPPPPPPPAPVQSATAPARRTKEPIGCLGVWFAFVEGLFG